ncbi:MAG: T9SS type A sorting domain-containing protein [Saprospiraceae bacterium]|nr:T9SS type A sorting domain-containing protein [Saprospiraceae bacterium]
MYQSYLQTLATVLLTLGTIVTMSAQMPIYSYPFDEGLEGWTPEGISSSVADSSANALWVWTPTGDAGTGAYNPGTTPIASASGGGALLFDSDGLDNGGVEEAFGTGPAPSPQRGEITSPPMDFTGESSVLLSFYQFYRYFAKDDGDPDPGTRDATTPASSFEISNDGGMTWTSFEVNDDIGSNERTGALDIVVQDISDLAAGQADVRVKFVWDGEYYYWLIDDVQLFADRGLDLAITTFNNVTYFETPDFGIVDDTLDLEVEFANHGDTDVTDTVMIWARVLDGNQTLVFSDTAYIDGIAAGDTLIHDFENWIPSQAQQNGPDNNYITAYNIEVKGDTVGEIVKPDDNVDSRAFLVSDFTYNKIPTGGSLGGFNGSAVGDLNTFAWGNVFKIPSTFTDDLQISRISFNAFINDADLAGKSVIAYVFEIADSTIQQGDTLLNLNFALNGITSIDQMIQDDMIIGIGTYLFNSDDDASGGPFFVEDVLDFTENEDPVVLEPGKEYFVAIQYTGPANEVFQVVDQEYPVFKISSLAYFEELGNFRLFTNNGIPWNAAIGLELEIVSTAVDENPLPENSVQIFPNPVRDFVTVDIDFETPSDATIFLADAQGKILMADTKQRIHSQRLSYNMTKYPSGNYIIRVATREGTKTEHILVTH